MKVVRNPAKLTRTEDVQAVHPTVQLSPRDRQKTPQ